MNRRTREDLVQGDPSRRRFIKMGAALTSGLWAASINLAWSKGEEPGVGADTTSKTVKETQAIAFIGHGAPTVVLDPLRVSEFHHWAQTMPTPRAIVVISAHWENTPLSIGATETVPLIYDFYGFPDDLYRMKYETPSASNLARQIQSLCAPLGPIESAPQRGLDHGAWIPLKCMYPHAKIPVVQVSLPSQDPKQLFALGQRLAPLRREGVLILASGNLTHNLRRIRMSDGSDIAPWAQEFDHWIRDALVQNDVDALLDYAKKAPAPDLNHPTKEHLTPVFVALGASSVLTSKPSFPIEGIEYYSISRRCVQWS
jgi:4,5-DOPA dioxygenase extradiol